MKSSANMLICGAGIAGIATAYHLAVRHGVRDILLVDERAPLSLTSDKSTECYRNWWPGPGDAMVALMNRSIDIMEELAEQSGNIFRMNRRGYLYLTADPQKIPQFERAARGPSELGAGPLRVHRASGAKEDPAYIPSPPEGFKDLPSGADLILDPKLIREHFSYLPDKVAAALHARRAGWFSAQQLGMYMFEQARSAGVEFLNARVTRVDTIKNRVQAVHLSDGNRIKTPIFINAAGPYAAKVGELLGLDLPLFTELHLKAAFPDPLGVMPRQAPLLIWADSQMLPWSDEERQFLEDEDDTRWLLSDMPPGAHTRPEGSADSDIMVLLWEYKHKVGRTLEVHPTSEPVIPPPLDELYPEIALRGMAALLPRFEEYFERMPKPVIDGGYYTKTKENRPLITPLPVEGAYLIGALSGFGLMAGCGAGDLLAAHITGSKLPPYAPAFNLQRYQDPKYQQLLENWTSDGQL
jgi:sarcosine oxidase, subunit beta